MHQDTQTAALFKPGASRRTLESALELHTQDMIDNNLDDQQRGVIWQVIAKIVKRKVIETTLKNTDLKKTSNDLAPKYTGNQSQAARMLGINRTTLRGYMKQTDVKGTL